MWRGRNSRAMHALPAFCKVSPDHLKQKKNLGKPNEWRFRGRDIIYAPFSPLHHALQTRCKILSKEVSYDSLRNSRAFQPAGLQHTNTPRLPLSYAIIPINEWNLFTSTTISAGSLWWGAMPHAAAGLFGLVCSRLNSSYPWQSQCLLSTRIAIKYIQKVKSPIFNSSI